MLNFMEYKAFPPKANRTARDNILLAKSAIPLLNGAPGLMLKAWFHVRLAVFPSCERTFSSCVSFLIGTVCQDLRLLSVLFTTPRPLVILQYTVQGLLFKSPDSSVSTEDCMSDLFSPER